MPLFGMISAVDKSTPIVAESIIVVATINDHRFPLLNHAIHCVLDTCC